MYVYLVKRQIPTWHNGAERLEDHIIEITTSIKEARLHVDIPNYDIIITRWTCGGGPDSEILIDNIQRRRVACDYTCCGIHFKNEDSFKKHVHTMHTPASERRELNEIKYGTKEDI